MQCQEAFRSMDPYLDGILADGAAAELTRHCEQCAGCRAELDERRGLLAALDTPELADLLLADLRPLPDDFTDQVLRRVAAERSSGLNLLWPWLQQRWSLSQYAGVAYALCATALVFAAGGILLKWEQQTGMLSRWGVGSRGRVTEVQARFQLTTAWLSQLWHSGLMLLR